MSRGLLQVPEKDAHFFEELFGSLKRSLSRLLDRESEIDADEAYASEMAGLNIFSLDSYRCSVPGELLEGYQIQDFDYPPGFPTVDRFLLETMFRSLDKFRASSLADESIEDGDIPDEDPYVHVMKDMDEMLDSYL